MHSTQPHDVIVDPDTGQVVVLLSKNNTLEECPVWWQNLIKHMNPQGHMGMRKLNQLLKKRYSAQLIPGDVFRGSNLQLKNLECYTRMVLEWS